MKEGFFGDTPIPGKGLLPLATLLSEAEALCNVKSSVPMKSVELATLFSEAEALRPLRFCFLSPS